MKKALLVLENNHIFIGRGVGVDGASFGECVFTTGMTGYAESLTDPSYAGQILCFSYPLIGNYGISKKWFESEKMYANGFIAVNSSRDQFHQDSDWNLDTFLERQKKLGILGIDVRKLVKILRNEGNQASVLVVADEETIDKYYDRYRKDKNFDFFVNLCENKEEVTMKNWPMLVTRKDPETFVWHESLLQKESFDKYKKTIVILDCGVKMNIVREISKRIEQVVVVPANYTSQQILEFNPVGVLLSNGPGDPRDYGYIKDTVSDLIKTKDLALFGICLGHQMLSLAIGCEVFKMKFGNRGANQPVQDLFTKKAYLTSQNHGYAVVPESIPPEYNIYFQNLNDETIEGITHKTKPIFSVQFHPEACGGPQDTNWLFDKFVGLMK
jgi:carbamoyl-phosphate synthase small subunit